MSKRCMGCMEVFDDSLELCPHCGYVVGTPAEEAIHMTPGTILRNRYIIGKVLGYGGFGVTYIAWDGKLEQKVAVKEFLPGEFSTRMPGQSVITVFNGDKSEQFRDGMKKFVDEAKRLAKFQNEPGIVKVFDSFEENSTAYIIMEFLQGETLTDFLKREGTVPADQAVEMLMPVMESLHNVHAQGLLHRDIAPDNIFITSGGEVKLIDFGASRYATTSHSRSLTVIIKPGFSPEEQYRSRGDQGPYTDVYAVAATLYKMITGKTPPDAMERRAKYENDSKDILVPPHKLVRKIPKNKDVALLNALNVRIEDRTQNIDDFVRELNADPPAKRKYGKIKKIDVYMWPAWLKILAPSMLGLIVVFSTLLLTNVISFSNFTDKIVIPDNIVIVPDVEGEDSDNAVKIITDRKLLAQTGGTIESEYITPGTIVLQNPVGGTYMELNSSVVLTVSSGTEVQEAVDGISVVPFVAWDDKKTAVEKLKKAGLAEPEFEEAHDEIVEKGCVISQSTEAGTEVKEGTKIKLVISLGPPPFELPDVKGKKLEEAQDTLTKLGLTVAVEYGNDDKVEKGHIISQNTAPKTMVKRGDSVTLVVSGGKETFAVVNTENTGKDDAVNKLKSQGFKVTVLENYDSEVEEGKVISQNPRPDSQQIKGTEVTIIISKGPQPVSVTLRSENGESDTTITVKHRRTYGDLPTPHKKGHEFLGWYTESSGGTRVTSGTTVENINSHSLFAHWKTIEYRLTVNNGTNSETFTVTYGQKHTLPHPERTDWYCTGWFRSDGSAVKEYGKNDTSSATYVFESESDQTVTAKWAKWDYKINIYDDADTLLRSKSVYNGDTYSLPDISTKRDFYTFNGWFTGKNGTGTKIGSSDTFNGHSDVNLYGYWTTNAESDWIEASKLPTGARMTAEKWTYTRTTGDWKQMPTKMYYYADFGNFPRDHEYYSKYEKQPLSGYVNEGESKRVINSESHHTYIYWHYTYKVAGYDRLYNRFVSDRLNDWTPNGLTSVFNTHEYNGTQTHTDPDGVTEPVVYYWDSGIKEDSSYWWYSIDVKKQSYTDYVWDPSANVVKNIDSEKEIKSGGEISDVKHLVKYIAK